MGLGGLVRTLAGGVSAPLYDLNFAAGSYTASLLAITRAQTVASYALKANGTLQSFAANALRVTDRGLLIEDAATNLVNPDFTTWTTGHGATGTASTTTNFAVAPDGTTTAWRVQLASNSDFALFQYSLGTIASTGSYTGSIWMKSNDATNYTISIFTDAGTTSNVTVTPTWQRFSVTESLTATAANKFQLVVTGGSSGDVSAWNPQVEAGTFATSEIPGLATRNADVVTLANGADTLLLTSSFSLFAELLGSPATNPHVLTDNSAGYDLKLVGTPIQDGISAVVGGQTLSSSLGSGTIGSPVNFGFGIGGTAEVVGNQGPTVSVGTATWAGTTPFRLLNGYDGYLKRLRLWSSNIGGPALRGFNLTSPAQAGGFTTLKFIDDFTTYGTIDMADARTPGFNWYRKQWFAGGTTPTNEISIANSVLTLNGPLQTAIDQASASSNFTGTVFGSGAYFEARIKFDPALGANASVWWPAFWSLAIEHVLDQVVTNNSQWPGQAAGYDHFAELDFFEAFHAANESYVGKTSYTATILDWSGILSGGVFPVDIQNNGNKTFSVGAVDWSAFHTYGCLWVPASGTNAPGYVQWFFDGIAGPIIYWLGPVTSPPLPGQAGNSLTPATPASATQTYAILDSQRLAINIGSDVNWPIMLDWVRVWQS